MGDSDTWMVTNRRYDARALERLCSVGTVCNGYVGLSGHLAERRAGAWPVTIINGVFDELDMFGLIRASNQQRPHLDPRYFDAAGKSPAVANLPNPLWVQTFVNERELSLGRGDVSGFEQSLDLRTGLYRYRYELRDAAGCTVRIEMKRFAALRHAHRVFMRYTLTPMDQAVRLRVHSGISGRVRSNIAPERQFHVDALWAEPAERCRLIAQTRARKHEVRIGVANVLRCGEPAEAPAGVAEHDAVYTRYVFAAEPQRPLTIERCVVLTGSEDLRHGVAADLEQELDAAVTLGFDGALAEQRTAWQTLWERCDVQIDGDERAQRYLRFCLHHLLAAGPRFSDRLSVPVKLLSGEHYQGSVFYDTETHVLPFYTFTQPELARTCLNFRHEGLRQGRESARNLGHSGAKLAWQAGPRGEECLGRWWRFPHTNVHVNADVAYALTQYVRATGDERFMRERGVELLVEMARFYASRVTRDEEHDAYDLRDVAGPDEGHCASTNNFYTNYLVRRHLRWAAETLERLAREDARTHAGIVKRLGLRRDEPDKWRHIADRLTLLFDPQSGVYEQCAGFFKLEPAPADLLDDRKTRWVALQPYQMLNQPDVVMALAMFRDDFDADVQRANWEFYQDKCLNRSSMSFAVNAMVAARVGALDEAYENFLISAGMDLDEALTGRGDTHAGLHGTAAGGAWLAAVFGFGGVNLSDEGLSIDPKLPREWSALRFNLVLRGVVVRVAIERERITLKVGSERRLELPISVAGERITLESGQTYTLRGAGAD